jgi:hypothetical protein
MNTQTRIKQEISAGRIQSQPYHAVYDTVLPDYARAELSAPPKRPRILGRPKSAPPQPHHTHWLALVAILLALGLVASLSSALRRQESQRTALATPPTVPIPSPKREALPPAPAPAPRLSAPPEPEPSLSLAPRGEIPAPAPIPLPTPDWNTPSLTVLPQPPRAQLSSLPAPRAALVTSRAPRAKLLTLPISATLHQGDQTTLTLPYGVQTLVTIRGYRDSFTELPPTAQIGDLYIVGQDRIPWVFVVTPGTNFAQWVDP